MGFLLDLYEKELERRRKAREQAAAPDRPAIADTGVRPAGLQARRQWSSQKPGIDYSVPAGDRDDGEEWT